MSVIPFNYKITGKQLVKQSRRIDIESVLCELLARTRRGECVGLWYLTDNGGDVHQYGFVGSYAQDPSSAYFPACKGLHALSIAIGADLEVG